MRKVVQLLYAALACLLLIISSSRCFAGGIETYHDSKSWGFFQSGSNFTTQDEKFENASYNWSDITNNTVKDVISLRVKDNTYISYQFDYTVGLHVEYYTTPGGGAQTADISLNVTYKPGQGTTYKGLDTYAFQGAYKVKVTISSLTTNGGFPAPAGRMLELSTDIVIDRTYRFQPSLSIAPTFTNPVNSQLKLTWPHIQGAEEYDVEWTTINDGNPDYNTIKAPTSVPADTVANALNRAFRNNASRVTTPGNDYTLAMLSTDDYMLVRIRQAQYTTDGVRQTGVWNYKQNTGSYAIWHLTDWHQSNLNWQYSAAFAEEGKKKEVISYFDGTLRGRQTVTINNSDAVEVAQENVYDEFGRPAASILPAPHKESGAGIPYLHYIPKFNLDSVTRKPYTFTSLVGTNCELLPTALSVDSGASNYYSPGNKFVISGIKTKNDFIPDAAGYPLSATQYTADNTGRIKVQGGVGRIFQPGLGSVNSKTTKYYYGKPEQWELDQLFGSDVGYAEHYLKNMVVDPNNQVSVSYLNASGKTIATALAGAKPTGLDALPSFVPIDSAKLQNVHVLKPEQFVFNNSTLTLRATTTYLNSVVGTSQNPATLTFDIQKLIGNYPGTFPICSNCYYEMKISVTNDCGQELSTKTGITQIGAAASDCNAGGTYRDSIKVPMVTIGEYFVTIEFALNNSVIDKFTDNFITQGKSYGYIEQQFAYIKKRYLDSIDVSGCYADCHTCRTLLGGKTDFVSMLTAKFLSMEVDTSASHFNDWAGGLYDKLSSKCDSLQSNCDYSPCSSMENLMLADVSPGGQYALFDAAGNALEPDINVITPNWRAQFPVVTDKSSATYQSELITLDNGDTISPFDASFTIQQLIRYWKPDWAQKFIQYHPEKCKLQFCQDHAAYENWDETVKQVDNAASVNTIPNAGSLSYSHSNSSDWLLNVDPFFAAGHSDNGNAYLENMRSDLLNYSTNILNAPAANNKSLLSYVDYSLYCSDVTFTTNTTPYTDNWTYCTPIDTCRVPDREWLMYRDAYMQLKQKYYNLLRTATCGSGACPIGQPYTVATGFNACPTAIEFAARADDSGTGSCTSGMQSVIIAHDAGAVGKALTVNVYYPGNTDTNGITAVSFSATDSQKTICIPSAVSLQNVSIQSVDCSGSSGSGPYYMNFQVDYESEGEYSDCYGPYLYTHPVIKTTYQNASGAVVQVPAGGASLTFEYIYKFASSGATSHNFYTITLSEGFSGTNTLRLLDFPSSTDCNPMTDITVSCVTAIHGATGVTGWDGCTTYTPDPPTTPPPPPPVSATCAAYAAKIPRFPDIPTAVGTPMTLDGALAQKDAATATINGQVTDMCSSNADNWMAALQPGLDNAGTLQSDRDVLRNKLIAICSAGSSADHPFGVSDLRGSPFASAVTPNNYGDAIRAVIPGSGAFTFLLNPYLLGAPEPYLVHTQAVPKVISTSSDTLCRMLTKLKQQANGTNLYTYLVNTYHEAMTLNAADVAALEKSCANCKFILSRDITLPVFLDTASKGVIKRSDYTTAVASMNSEFGNTLTTSSTNYSTILTNYMNLHFGFTLGYDDYTKYQDSLSKTGTQEVLLFNQPAFSTLPPDPYACVKTQMEVAVASGLESYNAYIIQQRLNFRNNYIATCSAAQANANIKARQPLYHYTLYYYDQADNLVRTIPPEGVALVDTARFKWIDEARSIDPAACQSTFDALASTIINVDNTPSSTNKTAAFTTLSQILNNNGSTQAIELWLYNALNQSSQMMEETPDQKYMFQVCQSGNRLAVEVYSSTPNVGSPGVTYTLSNQFVANIAGLLPLHPWQHIVVQSSNFASGTLQVYMNGQPMTAMSGTQTVDCSWSVTATSSGVTYPDNVSTLKHMRLYTRGMSASEIAANAASNCFLPSIPSGYTWYRFNVPNAGDPTTIAANTTDETRLVPFYPSHTLPTTYAYNSTNQVVQQQSPDGGTNKYWYDMLSRLSVSQNDQQKIGSYYSYTVYEPTLGRITEVGQKNTTSTLPYTASTSGVVVPDYIDESTKTNFLASGTNEQITRTFYDDVASANGALTGLAQNNLRKRVAATMLFDTQTGNAVSGLYYNYDVDGNVKTIYRQIPDLGTKRVDYEFDLVSGKVNFVRYQSGLPDRFYYQYKYDAENRLTDAWSATEAMVDDNSGSALMPGNKRKDAHYNYYLHGPLARVELGDDYGKVQGIDYAYTLQGWLKGVNSTDASTTADIGGDGAAQQPTVPKDAYSYALNYYGTATAQDYKPITGTQPFATTLATAGGLRQLYNGNITESSVNIPQLSADRLDHLYTYDQLNRITGMATYHTNAGGNPVYNGDYNESFTYDGNGNILSLNRSGTAAGGLMDALQYKYNKNAGNKLVNNQLNYITDTANPSAYPNDLKNQSAGNYTYDAIGNMTQDVQSGVSLIDWTVYGKIKKLTNGTGTIHYTYDPAGERVSKTLGALTTWYVRDAQGNTLAVYDNAGSATNWREQHLYGSSRLGMWTPNVKVGQDTSKTLWQTYGSRQYELINHLGNVLATITDRRIQHGADSTVTYYDADVATAQNYYAFGSLMPGRTYTASNNYRYGFNGKENDNDVKGTGNEQDYGMRIYDPRVGRFLSVDPLQKKFPWFTPYQFAGNSPIVNVDLDGLENANYNLVMSKGSDGKSKLSLQYTSTDKKDFLEYIARAIMGREDDEPSHIQLHYKGQELASFNSVKEMKVVIHGKTVAQIKDWDLNRQFDFVKGVALVHAADGGNAAVNEIMEAKIASRVSTNEIVEMEAIAANGGNIEAAEESVSLPNKKAAQLKSNNDVSKLSEGIVRDKLTGQLGDNQILMIKPRIYINDEAGNATSNYATPDFAILDKETGKIVKIVDAKNGNASLTDAQKALQRNGGSFRGSSRAPSAKPQSIAPNSIQVEKTNISNTGN